MFYLIQRRADNVADNPNEAVTCGAIKHVKWANEKDYEELQSERNKYVLFSS